MWPRCQDTQPCQPATANMATCPTEFPRRTFWAAAAYLRLAVIPTPRSRGLQLCTLLPRRHLHRTCIGREHKPCRRCRRVPVDTHGTRTDAVDRCMGARHSTVVGPSRCTAPDPCIGACLCIALVPCMATEYLTGLDRCTPLVRTLQGGGTTLERSTTHPCRLPPDPQGGDAIVWRVCGLFVVPLGINNVPVLGSPSQKSVIRRRRTPNFRADWASLRVSFQRIVHFTTSPRCSAPLHVRRFDYAR